MTINFNSDPYYDDYSELKDFYRILFRPGFAVQARELTQIQTILQNQVSRIGDHFFKNGSQIIPGSVNVDNEVHFAKLNTTQNSIEVSTYLTQFQNKIITGATSGVTAVVLDSSECGCVIDDAIPTLYFKYESTAADGETKRFTPGEELIAYAVDNTTAKNYRLTTDQTSNLTVTISAPVGNTTYTNNAETDVIGKGFVVEVKEGIYYIDGLFVRNDELHLYIGRFSNNPTARVGFKVVEQAIVPEVDTTLLDPAQGSYNYTAPGAHRYKVSLELTELTEESSGSDNIKFIELIRIKNGEVQHKITKTQYAELEKTLARRTNDLAGSYEVNKFKLSKREHLDNGSNFGVYPAPDGDVDKLAVAVDPGKAYVEGYEVEATATTFLDINKSRGTTHIDRLADQPVGTSIGNYIIIDNVKGGYANIENFETVDLVSHYTSLGSNNLSATDAQKVGTARVKSFEWHSGDYGSNPQYKVGLFDIQLRPGRSFTDEVKGIRRQTAGLGGTTAFGGNIVPDQDTGYITGTATNDPTFTGSGTTSISGTGTLFLGEVDINDVLVIDGEVVGTVAAVDANNDILVNNPSSNALEGRVQVLKAVLNDPEYPNLLFPVGYQFVQTLNEEDGTRQATLSVRRSITETTDGGGTWSHTLTNPSETYLSDQNLQNYSLFNEASGAVIDIDSGDISFDSDANRKTVYISGLSNSTAYTLITTVRQTDTQGAERTKTLTTGYDQEITGKKTVTAERITLDKADVLRITDIRVTPGDYDTYNSSNSISILDNYTLNNGQKPTHYEAASLVLKSGRKVPSGALQVTMDYFAHGATGNYFSVDSYTRPDNPSVGIDYENIPSTVLENGETIRLSDVLDFRPILGGTNTVLNELPAIGTDLETSIAYYLARVDKIVLSSTGEFKVIEGVPALNPKEPNDPKSGMVLATIYVPPYTLDVADTKLLQRDNRRYTMKELGKLERRLSSMEEYVALDKLEKLTADLQIIDPETGIDKFKNGFITDQFGGHSLGDVKNSDYRVSVDKQNKLLRPMHFTTSLDILEDVSSQAEREAASWQKTGDVISLPFTETSMIYNPYASRTIDVNPYKIGAFKGEIALNPEGDNWKDTDRRPDLVVTDDNGYDAIKFLADELGVTGAQWNEWENNWTGSSSTTRTWQTGDPNRRRQTVTGYEETITTETGTASRTGIDTQLSGSVNAQDYGDRVVDLSYIPYMRSRPVLFTAKNLKADTKFFPFFDNKDVNSYITPAQVFNIGVATGATYIDFNPVNLQNGVVSDAYERTENGKVEPAYTIGDIVKNTSHTAANIVNIVSTSNSTDIDVTVEVDSNILPGHHVILYNLAPTREINSSLVENLNIPESTISDYTKTTSKELNLMRFKVKSISNNVVTLTTIDGSDVPSFEGYDSTAWTTPDAGKLLRLQASAVVAFEGVLDDETDLTGSSRDIHLVNIKNGFAIGETLTGSIVTAGGQVNSVDIVSINGNTDASSPAIIYTTADDLRTDNWGSVVGTFHIPNNETQAFRTGERTFKLIDNRTNNDADFDSKGSAVYYSTGISLQKESTIVNSRDVRFVQDRLYEDMPIRRTSVSQRVLYSYYTGHDPVAQTFTVSSTGGAMVTSVDVFFSEAGNRPITVEIRSTNNGIPSTKIIPFSIVTKTPQQISTSDDGSVATTFNFDAPIYLQDGETYALVVKTDEPGCRFFVSEVGQTDLVTGNVITSQPLTGSLYLSQNSLEFEINPLFDMKFNLRKAVFSPTVATVDLKTAIPEAMILSSNPFTMATGTNKVRVLARNHGFKASATVVISGVADGIYGSDGINGFPANIINGTHTIISTGLDKDSFIIELDTTDGNGDSLIVGAISDIIKGEYGGSNIQITRQLDMDIFYLKSGEVSVRDTDISYKINAPSYGVNTFKSLVSDANYEFPSRESIKAYENQTIVSASPLVKRSSVRLQAILSTTNQNVSPLLDLQKMAGYVISNVINSASQSDINVIELDSTTLLESSVVAQGDTRESGTGTITTTTSSTAVTASGGAFVSQVQEGDYLYDSGMNLIGEVATITDNDNIVLVANAAVAVTAGSFTIQNNNHIIFYNAGGKGIIRSSLDTADNLLANATIGSWLYISNLSSHLNGYHEIEDIVIETADSGFAGNTDNDRITLTLAGELPIDPTLKLDLVQDHVDFDGTGTITVGTGANTVTGLSTKFNSELIIGQKLFASDGTELGTVATIVSDTSATLEANGAAAVTGDTYKVRFETTTYDISKLDKFVADYAPTNSYNYANYITRPLLLNEPADSVKVKFDAEIPVNADVDIYYRTGTGTETLANKKFINTGFVNTTTNPDGEFTEREFDLVDIDPYTKISIKIVMKSTNTVNVPKIKNLRLIAYS